jgi:hypothetical protein
MAPRTDRYVGTRVDCLRPMDIVVALLAGLLGPLVVFGLVGLRKVFRAQVERDPGEPIPRVTGFHIEPSQGKVEPLFSERDVVAGPVAWRVDATDRAADEALPRGGTRAAGATAVRTSEECSECIRSRIRGANYCLNCGRRITPG